MEPEAFLIGLFPFEKRIEVRLERGFIVVSLDGEEHRFRSTLLPRVSFSFSRTRINKRFGRISGIRKKVIEELEERLYKGKREARKVYRLVKRLLKIRKRGSFRNELKSLLREAVEIIGWRPRERLKRRFYAAVKYAIREIRGKEELDREIIIELEDEREDVEDVRRNMAYNHRSDSRIYYNRKKNTIVFYFMEKIVRIRLTRRKP